MQSVLPQVRHGRAMMILFFPANRLPKEFVYTYYVITVEAEIKITKLIFANLLARNLF